MFASGEKQPWAEPATTDNNTSSWTPNETYKRILQNQFHLSYLE
jgi:hypothetical protein